MLIHDLAFVLQEENTGRLMDCLKWIGNSYPEYPILSQFCVELINALNASELVTPPDTFKDRNEEKFQDYVMAWMHLLTTDIPTGTEARSAAAITRVTVAEAGYMPWTEPSKMAR